MTTVPGARSARIEIVDETSGVVLQTYRGIPLDVIATVLGWLDPMLAIFHSAATVKRRLLAPTAPAKGVRKRADR